jgi:hypothetical protein
VIVLLDEKRVDTMQQVRQLFDEYGYSYRYLEVVISLLPQSESIGIIHVSYVYVDTSPSQNSIFYINILSSIFNIQSQKKVAGDIIYIDISICFYPHLYRYIRLYISPSRNIDFFINNFYYLVPEEGG